MAVCLLTMPLYYGKITVDTIRQSIFGEQSMKKFINSYLFIIILVLFSAVYLSVSMVIFGNSTNDVIDKTTQMYMKENAKAVAAVFNTKLADQLTMLESQVRYFRDTDLTDHSEMESVILQTKGIGDFKNIGVANADGVTVNYNGHSSGNISQTDYFKEAMSGSDAVSESTYTDEDGDEVLYLAVPIEKNGKIKGIVFGSFTKDILNTLVDTASFGSDSANVLFGEDGAVIAYTPGSRFIGEGDADLYKMTDHSSAKEKETVINYEKNGIQMLAAITPVGLHGWSFATLLPRSSVSETSDRVSRYVGYIAFSISVSFILLLISILLLINKLSSARRERARIGAELNVATQIQADMLPKDFPSRPDIGLYATMTPAKEIGGDFYDFFFTDKDHIALVMADVAGKGVPAALFMVVAKVVIRNQVMAGGTPAKILAKVNNILCKNNNSGLFVTVWLGILDIKTGEIQYSNAGHEYPIIGRAGSGFSVLESDNGPPLAAMENMDFENVTVTLGKGDSIFLYTDGVPEAKSSQGERFGMEALISALDEGIELSAEDKLVYVKDKIDTFVGLIDPFDDITMLCLNFNGSEE